MDTVLKNTTRDMILAENAWSVHTFFKKAKGLLGKSRMVQEALFIPQCRSIHTCFMRFSIDVAFVNSENKVLKIKHNMKPFRLLFGPWETKGVRELPAGTLQGKLFLGDTVQMVKGNK